MQGFPQEELHRYLEKGADTGSQQVPSMSLFLLVTAARQKPVSQEDWASEAQKIQPGTFHHRQCQVLPYPHSSRVLS